VTHAAIREWLKTTTEFAPSLIDGRDTARVIDRRKQALRCADDATYLARLRTDADELDEVVAAMVAPETSFFRYPASYQTLAGWLRGRRSDAGDGEVRMLSVACSTGEEPCSMAITATFAGWPAAAVRVDAVDRSRSAVERARAGRYPARTLPDAIPTWAEPSLRRSDGEVRVAADVLRVIDYRVANVLALPMPGPRRYDVIFCRNLLIYLADTARRRLVAWLRRALAPDGLLFVGHAEIAEDVVANFATLDAPHAFALAPRRTTDRPATRVHAPAIEATKTAPRRPRRSATRPARPRRVAAAAPPADDAPLASAAVSLDDARALADRGELRPALETARTILEADGPAADVLELLGHLHLSLGDEEAAHECFFRAIYLEPAREASLVQLAIIADRRGHADEAARYRRRARRATRAS
jgi:chemotaxis protein methyltransferase WspC